MTTPKKNDKPQKIILQSTLIELQKAFDDWDKVVVPEPVKPEVEGAETEIRKKTQEILQKLNEQIKEFDL